MCVCVSLCIEFLWDLKCETYENIFHIPKSQQAREHDAIFYHQRD